MLDKNQRIMEVFHELKRNHGIKTQKDFADFIGVTEETITKIKKHRVEVSEDTIFKIQEATNNLFNLNWLRGEVSRPMLAKDVEAYEEARRAVLSEDIDTLVYPSPRSHESMPMWASNFIDIISKQVAQIEELRTELKSYKQQISQLTDDIKSYQSQLSVLTSQIADLSPGIHKNR